MQILSITLVVHLFCFLMWKVHFLNSMFIPGNVSFILESWSARVEPTDANARVDCWFFIVEHNICSDHLLSHKYNWLMLFYIILIFSLLDIGVCALSSFLPKKSFPDFHFWSFDSMCGQIKAQVKLQVFLAVLQSNR